MTTEIYFRPHHFLCTLCFQGKGYSQAFITHFYAVIAALNEEEANITVTKKTDTICTPCPHRREDLCHTEKEINVLDNAHAVALGILPSQQLSWKEAKNLIKEKITLEKFHQICATCGWKKYGMCEKVLTAFLNEENNE
ncbi:MAG: DUF1284 domain-containing protein [Gammaproteobacteria bacterium]|nr:DUF1284 domain-containing protein [Gammaproteobacteria bacterium]